MGDYEVSEVIGEGEEDVEAPRTPKEHLFRLIESYRAEDLVKLNLSAHQIIKDQKEALKKPEKIDVSLLQQIPEYQNRLKCIQQRMLSITSRSSSIQERLERALIQINSKNNKN